MAWKKNKSLLEQLVEGTNLRVHKRPSYIRISGPSATVAYAFFRSDESLRLQVRRADGRYPDKIIVADDADLPMARGRLEEAAAELALAKTASGR